MSGRIFISYRRVDDPGSAGRLFDALQQAFGANRLFIDVDYIEPGLDFVQVIEERLAQSDVLLAVIGSHWVDVRDADGSRRLDNPSDFVRLELEVALAQNKRVIPVLVGDARMLSPANLPESLRPLTRRHAVQIRHERFRSDTDALIKVLKRILDEPGSKPADQIIEVPSPVSHPGQAGKALPPATGAVAALMSEPANSKEVAAPLAASVRPVSRRIGYAVAAIVSIIVGVGVFAVLQPFDRKNWQKEDRPAPQSLEQPSNISSSGKMAPPAVVAPTPATVAPTARPVVVDTPAPAVINPTTKKYDLGATDTEIKVGNIMPYSSGAFSEGAMGKTEGAYFKKVNDGGGINGRKINFISYDDAYSASKAVEQVRKLVENDKVLLIFSAFSPYSNEAIQKYLNDKRIPQLFVADGAAKWGDPPSFPWTMGWRPSYQMEGRLYANYILQNKPNGKIAILYANDDFFGKDYLKGLKDGLGTKAAAMIAGEERYELSAATVDPLIVKLKATGADIFVNFSGAKFAAQAIRKAAGLGWKPMHFLGSGDASLSVDVVGRENAQGIISAAYAMDPVDPKWNDNPAMKEWIAFMKKYNPGADLTDSANIEGYNLARTLVQVLLQCGNDLTRENVMKQAASLKDFVPGLLLPGIAVNTSPTDFYPIEQLQLTRLEGKVWKLLGPQ